MEKNKEIKTQFSGGNYVRRPIEEVKAFKSKDGKYFVVQTIKTSVFPVKYVEAILGNDGRNSITEINKGEL